MRQIRAFAGQQECIFMRAPWDLRQRDRPGGKPQARSPGRRVVLAWQAGMAGRAVREKVIWAGPAAAPAGAWGGFPAFVLDGWAARACGPGVSRARSSG